MTLAWAALVFAIAGEVFGTFSLKAVGVFGSAWWYVGTVAGYALAFALLTVALRELPIGVTHAVWSGVGIIGAVGVGGLVFGESTDWAQYAAAAAAAVIGGVALMTLTTDDLIEIAIKVYCLSAGSFLIWFSAAGQRRQVEAPPGEAV